MALHLPLFPQPFALSLPKPLTYDIGVPVQREDALAGGGAPKDASEDTDADAGAGGAASAAGRVPGAAGAAEPSRLAETGGQGHRTADLATNQTLASRLRLEPGELVPARAARHQAVAGVITFRVAIRVTHPVAWTSGSGNGNGGGGGPRSGWGTLLLRANVQGVRLVASRGRRLVQSVAHFMRFRFGLRLARARIKSVAKLVYISKCILRNRGKIFIYALSSYASCIHLLFSLLKYAL